VKAERAKKKTTKQGGKNKLPSNEKKKIILAMYLLCNENFLFSFFLMLSLLNLCVSQVY
jgi:hypothetical protein